MKNRNGTLMSVADFRAGLAKAPEKLFAVAGDERLLAQLPKGNWVGGTIPYLMTDEDGGLTTRDSLMVQELVTDERAAPKISVYDAKTTNFGRWLTDNNVDTKLPLVADYNGALINVSVQGVDKEAGTVSLYAPVFKDRTYRLAKPMPDYVQGFKSVTAGPTHDVAFACNCTLNYVYGKLDGARVGLPGPFTFGEIAYQLLNQTMVYCDVVDAAVPHEGGRYFAQQMATAR